MKVHIKSSSSLTLLKLLKRRRMSLKQFLDEQAITTYEGLKNRCRNLGVVPPTESEYGHTSPSTVTNQAEGLIVLDPIPAKSEKSGKELEEVSPRPALVDLSGINVEEEKPRRRRHKRKPESVVEEEPVVFKPAPKLKPEVVDMLVPEAIDSVKEFDHLFSGNN